MGSDTGRVFSVGQEVSVRLAEATPVTGGLLLELLSVEGTELPRSPSHRRGKPVRRKATRAKAKADKTKRKVTRRRR